tara:strand:- start:344 stop:856 length:513 start_codon:yes stop_codon:yes gene_type:complete
MNPTDKIKRSKRIFSWKKYGLIHDDYKQLYDTYINTTVCNHCNKEFKNTKDRCMDHDHSTGLFRKIVCRACNVGDSYIKYPNGYDPKIYYQNHLEQFGEKQKKYRNTHKEQINESQKIYYQKNKDRRNNETKEWSKIKVTCGCGSITRQGDKSKHNKTLKHMDWWINSLD